MLHAIGRYGDPIAHVQHVIIVISQHGGKSTLASQLHHSLGVRPLCYQVAYQNDVIVPRMMAGCQQRFQLINAAMYVANKNCSLHPVQGEKLAHNLARRDPKQD